MAERARAEVERLRRVGFSRSPCTQPEPRIDSAQEPARQMGERALSNSRPKRVPETFESMSFRRFDFLDEFPGMGRS
jgi:hypothetical protein